MPAITDKYLRKRIMKLKKSSVKYRADIRPGRRRFGIYKYLRDVYGVYLDLRSRRMSNKTIRQIAKPLKLPIKKKSHPFRVLIEASAGPEDARQKSRWVQALRYALGWRQPAEKLQWFFKNCGGISGAAEKFAMNSGTTRPAKTPQKDASGELSGITIVPRAPKSAI